METLIGKHILIIPSERYLPKDSPLQGIFQQDQAHALKRERCKVGVISPELRSLRLLRKKLFGWPGGIRIQDDQGIPVLIYRGWYWIPSSEHGQIWLLLRAGMTLFKAYIRQHGIPEIIHAHNAISAGVLASKIKKKWHIPYVLTEHSTHYARGLIRDAEMAYIKDAFENADKRIVVSPNLGSVLEEKFGDSVRPLEYVPNILDNKFERAPLIKRNKKEGDKSFVFLSIGSMVAKKGQSDLLRAFAGEFAGKNNTILKIGGSGSLKRELEILTKRLKIEKQVFFLGMLSREQVLAEMQNCDVYVQSSHYETFGVVLIEAISCGNPVISTACGGPECIVREGNGVLLPPKDIVGLGKAMAVMEENIDGYDNNWIRNDCLERFGERAIVGRLSSIYQNVLSSQKESDHSWVKQ